MLFAKLKHLYSFYVFLYLNTWENDKKKIKSGMSSEYNVLQEDDENIFILYGYIVFFLFSFWYSSVVF